VDKLLILANRKVADVVISDTSLRGRMGRLECIAVDAASKVIDDVEHLNLLIRKTLAAILGLSAPMHTPLHFLMYEPGNVGVACVLQPSC
jgi:hypothetical protein